MNKYYIRDTTIGKTQYFGNLTELVSYLGNVLVPRATGMNRSTYTQHLIDLGHGYDDREGVMLTRALSETFDIGIFRNNKHVRTDVHAASQFVNENYGD